MKIAILDDYQNVASSLADWDSLAAEVVVFTKAFADADEAVRALAGFDVLVAMRERTRFPGRGPGPADRPPAPCEYWPGQRCHRRCGRAQAWHHGVRDRL